MNGGGWRFGLLALALVWLYEGTALAHPHVWVTVRSHVEFTPQGEVEAIVHDWVFDEMYSAYATQGLAPKGQLATRAIFAPLARENAGRLATVGYYTTLKIDGKTMAFAPVREYWMEERPDHLLTFHVRLNLKTPEPIRRFGSLMVADPEYFIDFEFDAPPNGIVLDHAPVGCSDSLTKPKPLQTGDKLKLSESFFTNLSPGSNFGFKMASVVILACP